MNDDQNTFTLCFESILKPFFAFYFYLNRVF